MRTLYGYWRSSASYRLRIALNLKMLEYEQSPVHLVKDGGQQLTAEYKRLNAQGLVPTLVLSAELPALTQSLAILEYLEEAHPEPPLLPVDPLERARVRALTLAIACEIHPLQNLRVGQVLKADHGLDPPGVVAWNRYWVTRGFEALEVMLQDEQTGAFCHGEMPTFADVYLVPQVYNARRFEVDLSTFPTICRIEARCLEIPAFREAVPEKQPDAPEDPTP
jgi:maleylpyruvate isomerase